jgi:hypothetical protein
LTVVAGSGVVSDGGSGGLTVVVGSGVVSTGGSGGNGGVTVVGSGAVSTGGSGGTVSSAMAEIPTSETPRAANKLNLVIVFIYFD